MGEMEFAQKALVKALKTTLQETEQGVAELSVDTPGGRFHVRWDEGGSATALGQLPFFAEFLEVSGLFSARLLASAPQLQKTERWPAIVRYIINKISTCSGTKARNVLKHNP